MRKWMLAAGLLLWTATAQAQVLLDAEVGLALPAAYNRVSTSGAAAIDLPAVSDGRASLYFRFRGGYTFADRHNVYLTLTPTIQRYSGSANTSGSFQDVTFSMGDEVSSRMALSGVRAAYRYDWHKTQRLRLGTGLSVALRDASVTVNTPMGSRKVTDLRLVPQVVLYASWEMVPKWRLMVDAETLPFGDNQLNDVFAGVRYQLGGYGALRVGYRMVQAKTKAADYTQDLLLHSLAAALIVRFGG